MKKKTINKIKMGAVLLLLMSQYAKSEPITKGPYSEPRKPDITKRCQDFDSINGDENDKFVGRFNWALKCFREELVYKHYLNPDINQNKFEDGRLLYPSFGKIEFDPNEGVFKVTKVLAPTNENEPCDVLPKKDGWTIIEICIKGCYTPDQYLLVDKGYKKIETLNKDSDKIYTINKHSTLQKLSYKTQKIKSVVKDSTDYKQEILVFKLSTGAELKVTLNHPLIDDTGRVRAASSLKIGEDLVNERGEPVRIQDIKKESYFGKVYNIDLASDVLEENLVLAQGVLNGSVRYQNEWVKNMNRQILRSIIPQNL